MVRVGGVLLGWFGVGLLGCGGNDAEPGSETRSDTVTSDVVADVVPDSLATDSAALGDAVADTTAACDTDEAADCLYRPPATYEYTVVEPEPITYTDRIGQTRSVYIALYRPVAAPTPMPVVLLSHGGATGKTNPLNSMEHWAPIVARSGYLAVAIAHPGRDEVDYDALCAALGVPLEIRCGVKLSWDRPHDVAAVLDWLEGAATTGPLAGQVDLSRVAHVGHSAGASATLMSVGATRNFVCAQPYGEVAQDCQASDLVSLADPRVDVAVALSPQGPGTEGFMDTSYGDVTRPVLIATGANDGDAGEPETRRGIFPLLPAGDKYELYLDALGAKHTLFEGNLDACTPLASQAECTAMRSAVYATAIAFLDAHLGGSAAAAAWLASDDVVTAGQGIVQLQRR